MSRSSFLSSLLPSPEALARLLVGAGGESCDHAAYRLKHALAAGVELKLKAIKETSQFAEGSDYPVSNIIDTHDDSRDDAIAPECREFLFLAETVDRDGVRAVVRAALVDGDSLVEFKESWPSAAGSFPDVVIFKSEVKEMKDEEQGNDIKRRMAILSGHHHALTSEHYEPKFEVGDLVWLKKNCDVYHNPDPGQPVLVVRFFDNYRPQENPGSEGHDFSFAHVIDDDIIITSAASWRFEKCPEEVVSQYRALVFTNSI